MQVLLALIISFSSFAASQAHFEIKPGKLHKTGKVEVKVLPNPKQYSVEMKYDLEKKSMVPVPKNVLHGKKVMDFPPEFRTEAGYKKLEHLGKMETPKAMLYFRGRTDVGALKRAYVVEVKPTNKKSTILITYHPSLPATGWHKVIITFLSSLPVLDGYRIVAQLK